MRLGLGSLASMVSFKPEQFLRFCGARSCVNTVQERVSGSVTCVLGGNPLRSAEPAGASAPDAPLEGDPQERVAAAMALAHESGGQEEGIRLIRAFDSEQDESVRMEVFRAFMMLFSYVKERVEVAAIRGQPVADEDRTTLALLQTEGLRMTEELKGRMAG